MKKILLIALGLPANYAYWRFIYLKTSDAGPSSELLAIFGFFACALIGFLSALED